MFCMRSPALHESCSGNYSSVCSLDEVNAAAQQSTATATKPADKPAADAKKAALAAAERDFMVKAARDGAAEVGLASSRRRKAAATR